MGSHGHFPTTRWSLIIAARQQPTPQSKDALAHLCATYRRIRFSPDSRRVIAEGNGTAMLWEVETGRQIWKREVRSALGSSISADLRSLIVPDFDEVLVFRNWNWTDQSAAPA
jgi:hypothetical protein